MKTKDQTDDKKEYDRPNDKFYRAKRKIIREAEQLSIRHKCDVFLFVHLKENDKIYQYQNDEAFNLEKISDLMLDYVNKTRNRYQKQQHLK